MKHSLSGYGTSHKHKWNRRKIEDKFNPNVQKQQRRNKLHNLQKLKCNTYFLQFQKQRALYLKPFSLLCNTY